MANDHLDRVTSVSAQVVDNGLQAKTNARTAAAIDRLGGNVLELLNLRLEKKTFRDRAYIENEKRLIDAATSAAIKVIENDPHLASTISWKLRQAAEERRNLDGTLVEALADLQDRPIPLGHASGPDVVSDEFLRRFEGYAGAASTEELRIKWGRVLGAEIRAPGTISPKVMRLIDEVETDVATLFAHWCKGRLGNVIPKALVGHANAYLKESSLANADLILEPGLGQIASFTTSKKGDGTNVWICSFGEYAVTLDYAKSIPLLQERSGDEIMTMHESAPALPCYILSGAGSTIASIMPNDTEMALGHLVKRMRTVLPAELISTLKHSSDDERYHPYAVTIP